MHYFIDFWPAGRFVDFLRSALKLSLDMKKVDIFVGIANYYLSYANKFGTDFLSSLLFGNPLTIIR
jgi:hypothetical protein